MLGMSLRGVSKPVAISREEDSIAMVAVSLVMDCKSWLCQDHQSTGSTAMSLLHTTNHCRTVDTLGSLLARTL